ncbi:GGDEF domain-containing protein [Dactylosporangium sp. NPDC049742]|uniref:GGDEF domain-containing protein n=1 Tax=Dactylosporangium sp. NPDC049742 TaxID=3154737 RepID=UPI003414A7FF
MTEARLPIPLWPFGPHHDLSLQVHELTVHGRNSEALELADRLEHVVAILGDDRSAGMIRQGRLYALISLGRLHEALEEADRLLQMHRAAGTRTGEAKILADTAEILIKLGLLDEGLHHLASALRLMETIPRGNVRYISAMSSVSEAARAAELYELADEVSAFAVESFTPGTDQRAAAELQRAELLLEWGLRLEHVGLVEEANVRFARSVGLVRYWVQNHFHDAPLATVLYTLGLVKIGAVDQALVLADSLVVPLRTNGHEHEARLAHLAYGIALRCTGRLREARREFLAADELAPLSPQRLIFQYELALLAAAELPGDSTGALLNAVRAHARHLWRLRLERRSMLQQARRRVDLEAARARADRVAASDALTGLGNRRQFDRQLAVVTGTLVLLLVDIDHFKGINDHFSHIVGDRVLREIAAILRAHCRPEDTAVRLGGDEFALFLRTDLPTAARIGERILNVVTARDWNQLAFGLHVTLSIGVAALDDGMDGRELYDLADRNLYTAKRTGRDRLAA